MPEHYYITHITPNGKIVGGPPNDLKMPLMHGDTLYDPSASQPHVAQEKKGVAAESHVVHMPPTEYDNRAAHTAQETPWRQLQNSGW